MIFPYPFSFKPKTSLDFARTAIPYHPSDTNNIDALIGRMNNPWMQWFRSDSDSLGDGWGNLHNNDGWDSDGWGLWGHHTRAASWSDEKWEVVQAVDRRLAEMWEEGLYDPESRALVKARHKEGVVSRILSFPSIIISAINSYFT